MQSCWATEQQGGCDLPHAVEVRRTGGAAQPRMEAFLWRLAVHIICAKEETKGERREDEERKEEGGRERGVGDKVQRQGFYFGPALPCLREYVLQNDALSVTFAKHVCHCNGQREHQNITKLC